MEIMSIIGNPICVGSSKSSSNGKYIVRAIDYDGTILKMEYLNEGDTFTLPNAPDNGLSFVGWSSPLTITDNMVTVGNNDLTIGAMYNTTSGATEVQITIDDTNLLTVQFNFDTSWPNIDWGDGTTSDKESLTHTYSSTGSYTVKIYNATTISDHFISQTDTAADNRITDIRINNSVETIQYQAFTNCRALKTISMPDAVYINPASAFNDCVSLQAIVLPANGGEDIPQFKNCYNLKYIAIASKINYMELDSFMNCYRLQNLTLPDYFISIGQHAFSNCYSMSKVSIPSEFVSNIGDETFESCYAITEYDFTKCNNVVILGSNCFNNISPICKIKVPSSLYNTYINASNWSLLIDYIEAV